MRKQTKIVDLNPKLVGERKVKLVIPHDWEIKEENGEIFLQDKRPQYPKTYEECCKILNIPFNGNIVYAGHWVYGGEYLEKHLDVLRKFQQLLICRDAYWKIVGKEMELEKPWEPDWCNENKLKYCIECSFGTIDKTVSIVNGCFLAFPTEEMRDTFFENFKDLINECKELL